MIDDHAHPFPLTFAPLDLAATSLDLAVREGGVPAPTAAGRLFQELLTTRLAGLLGTPAETAVAARDAAAAADWPAWVRRLLDDAAVEGIVLDQGVSPATSPDSAAGGAHRCADYAELAGRPVWELARVDPMVDDLLAAGASAAQVLAGVEDGIAAAVERGAVGLKTILAYRTGLAVDPAADLAAAQASLDPAVPVRRRGKALRDLVTRTMFARAAEYRLPVQVHTGLGDSDLRLSESDPLLLEELLRTPEGRSAQIVLIHGSFPWVDAAAYLAATRPNVWVELSLSNLFAPLHTADRLGRLLDLAPRDRVLVGTDGHGAPETHWFAALTLGGAWPAVAEQLRAAGARPGWIAQTRDAVFAGNAAALYKLT